MKKLIWLLPAVLLAMGVLFTGCPADQEGYEEGYEANFFDLNAWLKEAGATVGVLADDQGDLFKGNVLKAAGGIPGDVKIAVIETPDGELGLKLTTVANWGAGVDFRNLGCKFNGGDTINISGKVISGDAWMLDTNIGAAEKALGSVTFEDEFDEEIEMTQDEANAQAGTSPAGLRLSCKATGVEIELYSFTVSGNRSKAPERVTSIQGVPASILMDAEFELTNASVKPESAEKTEIEWSLADAGTTGVTAANLTPYRNATDPDDPKNGKIIFTPTRLGTLKVKATVKDGKLHAGDFVQEFEITVVDPLIPVTINGATAVQMKVYPGPTYGSTSNNQLSVESDGTVTNTCVANYGGWIYLANVNLGVGKTGADIVSIEIVIEGKSGDPKNKKIGAYVTDTLPSSYPGEIALSSNNYTEGEQTLTLEEPIADGGLSIVSTAANPFISFTFHCAGSPGDPTVFNIKSAKITTN